MMLIKIIRQYNVCNVIHATYLTFLPLYIFGSGLPTPSFFIKMKKKCKKGIQKNVQAPPFIYVKPFGVPDCTLHILSYNVTPW